MPITDHKIASSAFTNNDVKALPDMPSAIGYTAAQLKARFDNVAENIVTPAYNDMLDDLDEDLDLLMTLSNQCQYNIV